MLCNATHWNAPKADCQMLKSSDEGKKNEGKWQRFEFWLFPPINREEMSEGFQERLEENKFKIQCDLAQLESRKRRSQ